MTTIDSVLIKDMDVKQIIFWLGQLDTDLLDRTVMAPNSVTKDIECKIEIVRYELLMQFDALERTNS